MRDLFFLQIPLSVLVRGHRVPDRHRALITRAAAEVGPYFSAADDHLVKFAVEYVPGFNQHWYQGAVNELERLLRAFHAKFPKDV